ncbi:MAG TPA: four helix bundle protein [Bacteroidales bacterium]|nr:four helix bundle protein [Bacteroidales bacterium]HPF03213.1 four helix bundle protein [Bacteroidales bacterium]HPJ59685.1 four helix bundle protein [Bacteroidales bacterium]HPR12499.1 four helix bundle protein [Bacteroidales bacterium]HRW84898.1 four helix bundle protein [Bacteroidales bacterium]
MKLEELYVYSHSMELAEKIWKIVICWEYFARDTIGRQLVRAADSIASNLSEGFGRYHYRENIHFSYYSRGSLYETKTWLIKAQNRNLIDLSDFRIFIKQIDDIGVKLNNYINSIGKKPPLDNLASE